LISGASSGIGAAMVEALAQRGCSIILSARDAARLDPTGGLKRVTQGLRTLIANSQDTLV
jgi:short-subunit dehydrogenase